MTIISTYLIGAAVWIMASLLLQRKQYARIVAESAFWPVYLAFVSLAISMGFWMLAKYIATNEVVKIIKRIKGK